MPDLTPTTDDDLRVGDAERRAVDERLHRAVGDGLLTLGEYEERAGAVWAARTRGELAAVVRDLPGAAPAVVPAPSGLTTGGATRRAVAVMSEDRLVGPVAPGQDVRGYAVMGTARLDLAREDLPREVHVRAVAVMGEVEVVVPPGAHVHLTGASVMGERKARLGPAVAGGPLVHVHGYAVMGSVKVRSSDQPTGIAAAVQRVQEAMGSVGQPVTSGSVALPSPRPPVGLHGGTVARPGRRRRTGLVVGLSVAAVLGFGGLVDGSDGPDGMTLREPAVEPVSRIDLPQGGRDLVVTVGPDVRRLVLPTGSGDTTVELAAPRTIDDTMMGSGELECDDDACSSGPPLEIVRGGSGDVEVELDD